jgi:hypothetical protein
LRLGLIRPRGWSRTIAWRRRAILCIRPHPGSRSQNAHACDSDQSAFHRLPPFGQISAGKSNVRVKRMFRQMPGKLLSNPPHCRGGSCQAAPPECVALQGRLPGRGLGNPQGRNATAPRAPLSQHMGAEDVSWTAPAFGAGRPVSNIQGVPTVAACTFKMRPTYADDDSRQARRNRRRCAGRTVGWLRHVRGSVGPCCQGAVRKKPGLGGRDVQ